MTAVVSAIEKYLIKFNVTNINRIEKEIGFKKVLYIED